MPDKVVTPLRSICFTMAPVFLAFDRALALLLARAAATVSAVPGVI